jgi:tetratricopeptide (TPR) repeat protein
VADYQASAAAFEQALLLAPWNPDYYFNRGLALERAARYQEASGAFRWYLAAAPGANDRADVLARIGGLEAAAEKAARETEAKAEADKQRAAAEFAERRRALEPPTGAVALKLSLGLPSLYKSLVCSPINIRPDGQTVSIQRIVGCNEAEYNARNWQEDSASTVRPSFEYLITISDGQIKVNHGPGWSSSEDAPVGTPSFIGTIAGENVANIRWQGSNYRGDRWFPVWARLSSDGSSLMISNDRPLDDRSFDPKARYHYLNLVRNPLSLLEYRRK